MALWTLALSSSPPAAMLPLQQRGLRSEVRAFGQRQVRPRAVRPGPVQPLFRLRAGPIDCAPFQPRFAPVSTALRPACIRLPILRYPSTPRPVRRKPTPLHDQNTFTRPGVLAATSISTASMRPLPLTRPLFLSSLPNICQAAILRTVRISTTTARINHFFRSLVRVFLTRLPWIQP